MHFSGVWNIESGGVAGSAPPLESLLTSPSGSIRIHDANAALFRIRNMAHA